MLMAYETPSYESNIIEWNGEQYANTPRIKELIYIADRIVAKLPPVEENFTRLW